MLDDEIFDIEFEGVSTNCSGDPVVNNLNYILKLDSLVGEEVLYIRIISEGDYLIDSSFVFQVECGFGDSENEEIAVTKLLESATFEDRGHIYISEKEINVFFSFDTNDCFFTEEVNISAVFERL